MKEKTKQNAAVLLEAAALLLFTYPLGVLLGLFFCVGIILEIAKVLHSERLSCLKKTGKVILVCNHLSMADPFFIAVLLFKYYVLNPLRYAPLIVADRLNFYDSLWFWAFRPVMVSLDRGNKVKRMTALRRIIRAMELGRPIIFFPEGGRTFKGKDGEFWESKKGNKIRFLEPGIGLLAGIEGVTIIPNGIIGSDNAVPNSRERLFTRFVPFKKVAIAVGEPIRFEPDTSSEWIVQVVASRILMLMDEASA